MRTQKSVSIASGGVASHRQARTGSQQNTVPQLVHDTCVMGRSVGKSSKTSGQISVSPAYLIAPINPNEWLAAGRAPPRPGRGHLLLQLVHGGRARARGGRVVCLLARHARTLQALLPR